MAHLAGRFPEAYQRYVWGLEPRPHHLAWWGLVMRLLAQSATCPQGIVPPYVGPPGFAFEDWRERADEKAGEAEPPPVDVPRLYVVAPPGHAKSTIFSQVFAAWYLGHCPDQSLLALTSSAPMARQYHDTVRAVLAESDRHAAVFPDPRCRPDLRRGWSTDGLYLKGTPRTQKEPAYRIAGWSRLGPGGAGARDHPRRRPDPGGERERPGHPAGLGPPDHDGGEQAAPRRLAPGRGHPLDGRRPDRPRTARGLAGVPVPGDRPLPLGPGST